MKKLIWTIILAFGLATLPFGGTALAGQGHHNKAAAHAGKHHGKKHHANHARRHFKNK
jgi:hypothetical protein